MKAIFLFQRTLDTIQQTHTGKPFEIVFWDGSRRRFGQSTGKPEFVVHFKTRTSFMRSILQTTLGFGEGYVSGEILLIEGNLEDAATAFTSFESA